jgi:hypothetical protein
MNSFQDSVNEKMPSLIKAWYRERQRDQLASSCCGDLGARLQAVLFRYAT